MRKMASTAMVEKKPVQQQRPGGCVGIFFRLLDWNRRLAKKKLFSRKLLLPVRSMKRAAKKFGGDDKMPTSKLKLIADENRGGFPGSKKPELKSSSSTSDDPSNGMRTAGLVARLMGLETMPTVNQQKPRKALDSQIYYERDESSDYSRLDQDLCTEISGSGKIESRPQKIQKTGGFLEKRSANAAWFGADAFRSNKGMLTSSKKQHYKLPTPVKSPRALSRRSAARLMEAATKILDPASQSRTRALTYVGLSQTNCIEGSNATSFSRSVKDSLVGPCRSCGGLVKVSELHLGSGVTMATESGSFASDFSNASCSDSGSEEIRMKSQSKMVSPADQAKVNMKTKRADFMERKHNFTKDQNQSKPGEEMATKSGPKLNRLRQNLLPLVKDKVVSSNNVTSRQNARRCRIELNEAKNFVTLNKNLNKPAGTRSPSKVATNHRMIGIERTVGEKHLLHKRRTIGGSQIENGGIVGPRFARKRNTRSDSFNRKVSGVANSHSIDQGSIKGELKKRADGNSGCCLKEHGIVSSSVHVVAKKSRNQYEQTQDVFNMKRLSPETRPRNITSQTATSLRGDALSDLLEQKIRELTSLNVDELGVETGNFGRSTASILEELVSALITGAPVSQRHVDSNVDVFCNDSAAGYKHNIVPHQKVALDQNLQEEEQSGFASASLACESDQCSPISVLGASFSNESSVSGSINGISGHKPEVGFTESFGNCLQPLVVDQDLLDSATSIKFDTEQSPQPMDKYLKISTAPSPGVRYLESKLNDTKKATSDIELLFESIFIESDGTLGLAVNSFVLDILGNIVEDFCTNSVSSSHLGEEEESDRLKNFLFDCLMESLHSKYDDLSKSSYKSWLKMHLFVSRDRLAREINEEVRCWKGLTGKMLDDMIDKEMSYSMRKWRDCEVEIFETGVEIQSDILQILVDEIVADLYKC